MIELNKVTLNRKDFCELIGVLPTNLDTYIVKGIIKINKDTHDIDLIEAKNYFNYKINKAEKNEKKTKDEEWKTEKTKEEVIQLKLKNDEKIKDIFVDAYFALASKYNSDLLLISEAIRQSDKDKILETVKAVIDKINNTKIEDIEIEIDIKDED